MSTANNSQYITQRPPNQGMEMKDGTALVRDILAITTSAGDLSADGTVVGATTQTQVFTNGVTPSNIAAFSIVVTDTAQKLISGGVLTANTGLYPKVNVAGTGFDFVSIVAGGSTDAGVPTARVATTAVLPGAPVYANGAGGVGATLTRGSNGTLGTIDAVTSFQVDDAILVKNQAAQLQNGLYTVTVVGSGAAAYVLTRATTSDDTAEFDEQVIGVSSGTTNGGTTWGQTTVNPTVGVSNIVYAAQTGTFMTQAPTGTQAVNQIPYYTATARRLARGEAAFTYDPATNLLTVDNILSSGTITATTSVVSALGDFDNITIGDGTTGLISDGGRSIVFDTVGGDLLLTSPAGECSVASSGGLVGANSGGSFLTGTQVTLTSTNNIAITGVDIDASLITGDFLLPFASFLANKDVSLGGVNASITLTDATGAIVISAGGNIDLDSVTTSVNGAATYTGTVAGSAALNIVNGLVMQ